MSERHYTPARLRSWLFVPGDRPERFEKALGSGADAVIFDLEDAVQDARVAEARASIADLLSAGAHLGPARYVRVRGLTPYRILHEDLDAVVRPALDGLVLPKLDDPALLQRIDAALDVWEAIRGLEPGSIRLAALIEHPRAVVAAAGLAAASSRLHAFLFGAEDYANATGLEASVGSSGLTHARVSLVMAAQAAGLEAVDMVERDFQNPLAIEDSTAQGRGLGFSGKLAIHPAQIAGINAGFGPSAREVERALNIVRAWEGASASGVGAISVDGEMVDLPVVERARRLLQASGPEHAPREGGS